MIWFVSASGSDSNDGQTPATAFLTPTHAVSVATAGDTIVLGAGTFAIGSAVLNLPSGVSMAGAGIDVSIITSTADLAVSGCIVCPGSNSQYANFTVQGIAGSGVFQGPFGANSSVGQSAATGVTVRQVHLIGDSDGIYISTFGSLYTVNVYDSIIDTKFDCSNILATTASFVNLHNCYLTAAGPSSNSSGATARALVARTGTANVYGGSLTATNATTTTRAVQLTTTGVANLYDVAMFSASATGTVLDLDNQGTSLLVTDCAYSAAKTSGTITIANTPINQAGQIASAALQSADLGGKVLGTTAGGGTISGVGMWALDGSGNAISTASSVATLQTSVNNLNNLSSLANLRGPSVLVIPASGSEAYLYTMTVNDSEGHLIDLTASPTVTAYNAAGTDRSSNLSSVTHVSTGTYTWTYTVQSTAAEESLTVKGAGTATGDSTARVAYSSGTISATDTAAAIAAIQAQTDKIGTNDADSPNAVTAQGTISTNLNATVGSRSTYSGGAADANAVATAASAAAAAASAATAVTQTTGTAIGQAVWNFATASIASGANVGKYLLSLIGVGAGPIPITVNVKDASTSANIVGARVSVTVQSANGQTDGSGNVTLALTAGTVQLLVTAPGFNGYAGALVVTGTATVDVTLTAVSIPTPGASQTTCYLHTYDQTGTAQAGVGITFQITAAPVSEAGKAYSADPLTVASDVNGLVSTALPIGASVQYRTANGQVFGFVVPESGPYELPDIFGGYA